MLFVPGKTGDKFRIIFDMCDNDGNGVVDKREFGNMLHSLVDIAKTNSLTDQETKDLIEGMFAAAGLEDKDHLSYDDFKLVMKEYKGDFIAIGLDCKGTVLWCIHIGPKHFLLLVTLCGMTCHIDLVCGPSHQNGHHIGSTLS